MACDQVPHVWCVCRFVFGLDPLVRITYDYMHVAVAATETATTTAAAGENDVSIIKHHLDTHTLTHFSLFLPLSFSLHLGPARPLPHRNNRAINTSI